jgi:hypothetical protein
MPFELLLGLLAVCGAHIAIDVTLLHPMEAFHPAFLGSTHVHPVSRGWFPLSWETWFDILQYTWAVHLGCTFGQPDCIFCSTPGRPGLLHWSTTRQGHV